MSEDIESKCNQENKTLKLICEIEKNYRVNFEAQAELFKAFFKSLKTNKEL